MKKTKKLILLLLAIITLPYPGSSQQLAHNYNLRQKSVFTENKGQVAGQEGKVCNDVKYLYLAPGLKMALKSNSFSYDVFTLGSRKKQETEALSEATGAVLNLTLHDKFKKPEEVTVHSHRIDVSFVGANPNPEIIAEERSSDYNNYFLAHTQEEGVANVYSYSKLTYKNLYPAIDIVFYAKEEGKLKYDIVVHPGGKLEDVKMKYDGADILKLENQKLKLKTALADITEKIPYSFIKETRQKIQIQYVLEKEEITFKAKGNCDRNKTLIIDPELVWGTYFGGNSFDFGYGISIDKFENIYLAGTTVSTSGIATSGVHQTTYSGNRMDVFIAKFSSDGKRLWGTYYGGYEYDEASAICVDGTGNIFITGKTSSTSGISTKDVHQEKYGGGNYDAFVAKFYNNGIRAWGSYYGGENGDNSRGISLDNEGNFYITGGTESISGISTPESHQSSYGGRDDAFIVKFNNDGVRQWGTYYGGNNHDQGKSIIYDQTGNIYITGRTGSTDFDPVSAPEISTAGAHQETFAGASDAFIVKFNTSGERKWGTYYGGENEDDGISICTDDSGNVYLTGTTGDFSGRINTGSKKGIATKGAHLDTVAGNYDAFVVKFDSTGARIWGTYYGGKGNDAGKGIYFDGRGSIYIIGNAESDSGISTPNAYQPAHGGDYIDAFIVKFNTNGVRQWGTYYGGNSWDDGNGVVTNNQNTAYFTGSSRSRNAIATKGAYQETLGSLYEWDAFLLKFTDYPCSFHPRISGSLKTCTGAIQRYEANYDSSISYKWAVTDGRIISGQGTNVIEIEWTKTGNGIIKLIATSLNCEDSVKNIITIEPYPVSDFQFKNLCYGDSISFINTSTSAVTYIWDFGDGNTSNATNPSHKYSTEGTYTVILKGWNGAVCTDSASKLITIYPLPATSIKIFRDSITGRSFTFTSLSDADNYVWSFGDGTLDSGKTVKHTFNDDGTYTILLALRDTNGCNALYDTTMNIITVGITHDQLPDQVFRIYPNPFTFLSTLEYNLEERTQVEIFIYDLAGKEVACLKREVQFGGKYIITIDTKKYKLKPGVYILMFNAGNKVTSRQLIKLKE